MGFHVGFARDHGVLPFLLTQADLDGVKVPVELMELQLALRDLVEGDPQQAVLVELADVVKPCTEWEDVEIVLVDFEVAGTFPLERQADEPSLKTAFLNVPLWARFKTDFISLISCMSSIELCLSAPKKSIQQVPTSVL